MLIPEKCTLYIDFHYRLLIYAGEAPEVTERDAIKAAVEKRIDSLDEFFVATLRLFAQAASEQSNHDLASAFHDVN